MTRRPNDSHGGQILVDALKVQGTERVFCVPGESYLAALDGLYASGIDTIVARQEGGASMMAEAHAKLTGQTGVAFVTRGPGATNAASGVHVAMQDSTPMVLFIGQVASDQRDREAFQEVDYRAMFGPLAKWVGEIDRFDRIGEYISHAFHVAQNGRPGPVVLSLPEDMLSSTGAAQPVLPAQVVNTKPSDDDLTEIQTRLSHAERPLIIIGGGAWSAQAATAIADYAQAAQIPVAASFRCQDYIDNRHANYVGDVGIGINPALAQMVRDADQLLVLGPRMGEMTTSGYTLLDIPNPKQNVIHVFAGPDEIGRVFRPDMAVVARPSEIAKALAAGTHSRATQDRESYIAQARASYLAWQDPRPTPGDVQMEQVIAHLSATCPEDAIVTNGAGNYAAFLHRYFRYKSYRTQLAPTSGSMGYGLPAAVAAKLHAPEREVICLAGDGCFQMVMQEFGTAAQYGANIITVISDNGMYGTIRMHQQKHYPKRPSGTSLVNPDFEAIARAYGGYGATVRTNAAFVTALAEARASQSPSIIRVMTDPQALSPIARLEET